MISRILGRSQRLAVRICAAEAAQIATAAQPAAGNKEARHRLGSAHGQLFGNIFRGSGEWIVGRALGCPKLATGEDDAADTYGFQQTDRATYPLFHYLAPVYLLSEGRKHKRFCPKKLYNKAQLAKGNYATDYN